MKHQGQTDSIHSRPWRAPTFFPPTRLLLLLSLTLLLLLVSVLAAPDGAQAADQLWFKSTEGEWAVTSGVADDDIGRALARGVPKRYIRYSIEGVDGFSIGRRSGRVSYDGTSISAEQVSLTVTARDKRGEAASATRALEVSVTQPEPDPAPTPTPTPEPEQPAEDGAAGQDSGDPGQAVDNVAPTVSSLRVASTPAAHDSYAPGETITMEVTFSEPVLVTGVPCLLINVGRELRRPAAYASGSGTDKLLFSYTVVAGDRDRRGIMAFNYEGRPLRLSCTEGGAAGTIRDAAHNDADLRHRSYFGEESKHMVGGPKVISDRTRPTVTDMQVISSPESGDTYRDRETIRVQVTFSEPVVADSPRIGLWIGQNRKDMTYREGTGTNKLTFGYRVRPEDRDSQGISIVTTKLPLYEKLGWPSITDSADNFVNPAHEAIPTQSGHKVAGSASDSTPPSIRKVGMVSAPGAYVPGDKLIFYMAFTEPVQVVGDPYLNVTVGGKRKQATYQRHNPENDMRAAIYYSVMSFSYTVQEGDGGVVAVAANSLQLPQGSEENLIGCITHCVGYSVRDLSSNHAVLTHDAFGDLSGYKIFGTHVVDGGVSITSSPADGDTYRAGETITVAVRFNRNVTVTGAPTLTVLMDPRPGDDPVARYSGGTGTNTLTFAHVVTSADTDWDGIEVHYRFAPIVLDDSSSIKDEDGNDALLVNDRITVQRGHKVDGR